MHLEQAELARRAQVSLVTIRRIEAAEGAPRVASATLESVRRVLEESGVEFIPNGVRLRANSAKAHKLSRWKKLLARF